MIHEQYLRTIHPEIPDGWEVHFLEYLPVGAQAFTHVRCVGSIPRFLKSGPRKGRKTWHGNQEQSWMNKS